MVNKPWMFMGYLSAFFSVYLMSVAYSIFPTIFDYSPSYNTFTYEMNATAVTSVGSWAPTLGLVIAAMIVIGIIFSGFSMRKGLK